MYTRCDNAVFAHFVAAMCRTNSNQFEFVRHIAAAKFCRNDLLVGTGKFICTRYYVYLLAELSNLSANFFYIIKKIRSRGAIWNHLPLRLRTSSSVNIFRNALYKYFKLSQLKNNVFTPFLDNNF